MTSNFYHTSKFSESSRRSSKKFRDSYPYSFPGFRLTEYIHMELSEIGNKIPILIKVILDLESVALC